MEKRLLPINLTGSKMVFPYLAGVSRSFKGFSTIIVLVEKDKKTIVVGRYTGEVTQHHLTYANGAVFRRGSPGGFHPSNLVPLNLRER